MEVISVLIDPILPVFAIMALGFVLAGTGWLLSFVFPPQLSAAVLLLVWVVLFAVLLSS